MKKIKNGVIMDNNRILDEIVNPQEQAVFKGMRSDMEAGKGLLNPEQLGKFLRAAQINNVILNDADFQYMKSFKKQLPRVGISGRVLQSGYDSTGKTNPNLEAANVEFSANELDAKKLKTVLEIQDDEKEDNLEQESFENTLLSMMGERVGEDLEFWAIFADTDISYSKNSLLSTTDGWIKDCETKLYSEDAATSDADFDVVNDTVEAMFDSMLYAMDPRFRQKRTDLKFYVPYEVEDAYRNLLKSRGTPLGDSTQTGYTPLAYKGIPVVHCPTLDAEDGRGLDDTATSFLTNPKNFAWGVWKNLSIEPERIPKDETTKYWYRIRGDVKYYFNEGTICAKMSSDEIVDLPIESKT